MPEQIATLVQRAQRRFPDLTTQRAIELANLVHRELNALVPSLRRTPHSAPVQVTFSSGTKEAPIPEHLSQVDAVLISGVPMQPTSVETLNRLKYSWRAESAGVPKEFYVTADDQGRATLGLHPTPNPGVVANLYGTLRESGSLVAGSSISEVLPSGQAYVDGICYYAALELRPSAAAGFLAAYQAQSRIAQDYVQTRSEPLKDPLVKNSREKK